MGDSPERIVQGYVPEPPSPPPPSDKADEPPSEYDRLKAQKDEILRRQSSDGDRALSILRKIIDASDHCVGHAGCDHDTSAWKEGRALVYGDAPAAPREEPAPPSDMTATATAKLEALIKAGEKLDELVNGTPPPEPETLDDSQQIAMLKQLLAEARKERDGWKIDSLDEHRRAQQAFARLSKTEAQVAEARKERDEARQAGRYIAKTEDPTK